MVLERAPLNVPEVDLPRFADEICPALRRVAAVVSSDASFAPPEISAPSLVLRARYGERHTVDLGWEWAYTIGGTAQSAPFGTGPGGPGFGDLDADDGLAVGVLTGAGEIRVRALAGPSLRASS